MLQVLILLIVLSDFYMFQAISTRDTIISIWKLYVFTFHLWYTIKCLMDLLTIVYVNIEICCKCWYCWLFYPDFYMFQAISTRDAIISSRKLYVFTFYLWYSIKCLIHLTIVYVNIETCCKCWYCWFFPLTFTCSRPFRRGMPSSPVENCMFLPFIYDIPLNALVTIGYVNIEICCKCWYCWLFHLTFTCSGPFRRGTPSSPFENCMFLPYIYDIQLNTLCIY